MAARKRIPSFKNIFHYYYYSQWRAMMMRSSSNTTAIRHMTTIHYAVGFRKTRASGWYVSKTFASTHSRASRFGGALTRTHARTFCQIYCRTDRLTGGRTGGRRSNLGASAAAVVATAMFHGRACASDCTCVSLLGFSSFAMAHTHTHTHIIIIMHQCPSATKYTILYDIILRFKVCNNIILN